MVGGGAEARGAGVIWVGAVSVRMAIIFKFFFWFRCVVVVVIMIRWNWHWSLLFVVDHLVHQFG